MDICEQIANTRKKQLDAAQAARDAKAKEFTKLMKAFRAKLPQLREAERIFLALKENKFLKTEEDMWWSQEKHYANGYFLSDGWYHWPGFSYQFTGIYYTCGGGACRFSCGININTGKVVVAEREFDTPTTELTDTIIRKVLKSGSDFHTKDYLNQGDGSYYTLTGSEILSKLQYCYSGLEKFCKAISDYAKKIVNK